MPLILKPTVLESVDYALARWRFVATSRNLVLMPRLRWSNGRLLRTSEILVSTSELAISLINLVPGLSYFGKHCQYPLYTFGASVREFLGLLQTQPSDQCTVLLNTACLEQTQKLVVPVFDTASDARNHLLYWIVAGAVIPNSNPDFERYENPYTLFLYPESALHHRFIQLPHIFSQQHTEYLELVVDMSLKDVANIIDKLPDHQFGW